MCRPGGLLPGLLLALLAGCAADHITPGTALANRFPSLTSPSFDAVELVVAVIERRVGDPYLDKEVWTFTDEQVVDLEQKAILDDNGFRVGQVVGMTPAGLQSLLTSERALMNGRRYFLGQGKSETLAVSPALAHCRLQVIRHGDPTELSMEDARFGLIVQPQMTSDGRTRLHFTPQVDLGDKKTRDFRIAADGSGLELENKRPGKTFSDLSWDVTVPPNQYLLISGRLDQPGRLGNLCFIQPSGPSAAQRLLVIRANRVAGAADEGEYGDNRTPRQPGDQSVPLALQAIWATH